MNRCSPRRVHTSTVKKSAATISSQCWLRNSFQVVFRPRSGAGQIPCVQAPRDRMETKCRPRRGRFKWHSIRESRGGTQLTRPRYVGQPGSEWGVNECGREIAIVLRRGTNLPAVIHSDNPSLARVREPGQQCHRGRKWRCHVHS
jgi:hypothetical protein